MSKWYKASELERLKTLTPRDGVTGLPDNHVITVSERVISIDNTELIQNNIATDTFTLVLDAEWDGITPIAIFSNAVGNYSVMYEGSATKIPAKVMERTGDVEVSVYGVNEAGDVRVVTQRPESMGMTVIESGKFDGQVSSDDVSLLGKILAAVEKAEQSVETANQSAENANTAAQSATDAATKATQAASTANAAANTANTAASNADSSANAADTAAERAENAYDALTPIIAEIGVNGNQPRATTNPNHVATASDAYAAKPLEICIKGQTRQNLWVNPSGSSSGVTVTSNADGSVKLTGTPRSNSIWIGYTKRFVLRPGSTYTLTVDKAPQEGVNFRVESRDAENTYTQLGVVYSGRLSHTFTVPSDSVCCHFLLSIGKAGTTVSGTYRVMLNEGSEAEPWCPPGLNGVDDDGSVKIVTAGKNLLKFEDNLQQVTRNGITFTPNEDGTVTVNGTATGGSDYYLLGNDWNARVDNYLPAQEMVFSSNGTAKLYGFDSSGSTSFELVVNGGNQIVSAEQIVKTEKILCYLSYASGYGETNKKVYAQLELGSTATAYEPPNITTTPVDLDGHTLNSLPDGTRDELRIDGTGAVTLTKRMGAATYDGSSDEVWGYSTNPNRLGLGAGAPGSANIVESGNALCDTLPVRQVVSTPAIMPYTTGHVDLRNDAAITDVESGRSWLASNPTTLLYPLATPQTIPLTSVTLPTLPSPNITVYHDSDVPSDMTLEYERDVTIAFDKLQAQVSATTVREATNG